MHEHRDPDEPTSIEEAAGEQLGVQRWDRPLIFREAADAAVDNGLTYWLVLMLSGAIATLGLALDSTAVVIGAMLVAPLLAPIVGLSLGLAVGDARLALQCGVVVAVSLIAVIVTSAALTAILPFQTVTLEISSRIHPTTLDLGIAVFSGLVGALVAVDRGGRISMAIPGVAVAVALIPPLSVTGFGIAAGWRGDVITGSLLLLGANLAGIVLSGVLLFMLIGMQGGDVVKAARDWHDGSSPNGLARLACRIPGAGRARVFGSAPGRAALVLGFVIVLAIPLTAAMREVAREIRVRNAVQDAVPLLEAADRTTVLEQRVELGDGASTARVRVATASDISPRVRESFRRRATEGAGEPVELILNQLPSSAADAPASALDALLRGGGNGRARPEPWPETVARARERLARAAASLPFPPGAEVVGATLIAGSGSDRGSGGSEDSASVGYLAAAPLEPQALEVLELALRQAVRHPALVASFDWAGPAVRSVAPADTAALREIAMLLRGNPALVAEVRAAPGDSAGAAEITQALVAAGVEPEAVRRVTAAGVLSVRIAREAGAEP